jgi:REP-associated tyrosine transposase
MVIAHHLMWTLYGWWLPNDPRGSTSKTIQSDLLRDLGGLHSGRKQVQPASRDIRGFYQQAADRLGHELLSFDPGQFPAVAQAFDHAIVPKAIPATRWLSCLTTSI